MLEPKLKSFAKSKAREIPTHFCSERRREVRTWPCESGQQCRYTMNVRLRPQVDREHTREQTRICIRTRAHTYTHAQVVWHSSKCRNVSADAAEAQGCGPTNKRHCVQATRRGQTFVPKSPCLVKDRRINVSPTPGTGHGRRRNLTNYIQSSS